MAENPLLLSVSGIELERFAIETRPGYDRKRAQDVDTDFEFGVAVHTQDARRFRATLSVQFPSALNPNANLPYAFQSTIVGYFQAPFELDAKNVEPAALANALLILYGSLRGYVSAITGSASHGAWMLPTVSFMDLLLRRARRVETPPTPASKASAASIKPSPRKAKKPANKTRPRAK